MQQPNVLVRRQLPVLNTALSVVRPARRFARRQPVGFVAAVILLTLIVMAVIGPEIVPYEATEFTRDRLEAPSLKHPLGTDQVSRDVLSRVISGARVSLQVGLASVALGIGGGAVVGVASGYFGGRVDTLVQRIMDAMLSFPSLVLALALAAVMNPGLTTAILAIGVTILPSANRVVRGSTLSIKENVYVEAARALGASNLRIMMLHIVPEPVRRGHGDDLHNDGRRHNYRGEPSRSLGLGVQPPSVSWGEMINSSGAHLHGGRALDGVGAGHRDRSSWYSPSTSWAMPSGITSTLACGDARSPENRL